MSLIFKVHCILWLFMASLAVAVGVRNGHAPIIAIALPLGLIAITGILGAKIAPMVACFYWIGMIVTWITMFAMGYSGHFIQVALVTLLFAFFALISFVSYNTDELMKKDVDDATDPTDETDQPDETEKED